MNRKLLLILLLLTAGKPVPTNAQGSEAVIKRREATLVKLYGNIMDHLYGDEDTLAHYSSLFIKTMKDMVGQDPGTMLYDFKRLTDSNICYVQTSADGRFRIYSWDTWLGGTMHFYRYILQYKTPKGVRTVIPDFEEGNPEGFYSDIFTLKTPQQTYYLALCNSQFTTKDRSQNLEVFAINGNQLDDKVKLIKTATGLHHDLGFEYDYLSISDLPDYRKALIRYDPLQKIIILPLVQENGNVTQKTIRYRFTGKYFEKM